MRPALHLPHLPLLAEGKNLLAFSAGIDSSALFFLLREHGVDFDIALVNYGTREQSSQEEKHAQELANRYGLRCYTTRAPRFESRFECRARRFRYAYFASIIREHGYDNLLTAHQLNDRLEWMLMRLSRGAGLGEMTGMESLQSREGYTLIRPLLGYAKSELLAYLEEEGHPYFVDESNDDARYERNAFRKQFADPLIARYREGIARSFAYLAEDVELLDAAYTVVYRAGDLRIVRLAYPEVRVRACDRTLKQLGYLMSAAQRREVAQHDALVVGGVWAVAYERRHLWIAPYRTDPMPKRFKEQCRTLHIPPHIRPYLYTEGIDPAATISSR